MVYVTKQDLIDRGWEKKLIQLTDRTNKPATTIDETTVDRHITDACSVIDSYLAKVYALPLSSTPPALKRVAADLAMYLLHGDAIDKDGPVAQAYRDGIRWLENVAKGLVVVEDAGVVPQPAGDGRVQLKGPDRVFDRDSLRGL